MTKEKILSQLHELAQPENLAGMSRFAIPTENALGINIPELRALAKEIGKNHKLALELWETKILEARILATLIDEPKLVTEAQMERWVRDFDGWSVCDAACGNLFDRTELCEKKIFEWTKREEEFVKRAGFVLIATSAVHNKKLAEEKFFPYLELIEREAHDERNFVRKAVNWALRQIGKRNFFLNGKAIETAEKILLQNTKSARWIASDALRELRARSGKLELGIKN